MEKTVETSFGTFYIRPYQDEDMDNVIELWEAAFKSKIDRKIWRWKFHENPFGRQIMLCVNEAGLPVAMYAGIPFSGNWNGQEIKMSQIIDNMSHPDFRQATSGRKGLNIQTAEHFFHVYGGNHASGFLYGFPGLRAYRLGNLFLQYNRFDEESCYMELTIAKIKKQFIFPFGYVKPIFDFDRQFDLLWNKAQTEYPLSIKRDSKFLNWRFTNNPINSYDSFAHFNKKDEMLSYAVFRRKQNLAILVDVFAKNDAKTLEQLVFYSSKELCKKGIEKIQVWLPNMHFISGKLKRSGFKLLPEPLGILPVGRSFIGDLTHDFACRNIFYTMADGDLF